MFALRASVSRVRHGVLLETVRLPKRKGTLSVKKLLLGTIALVTIGSVMQAAAADMAARPVYTKAPPAPAPVAALIYDWSGLYVGGNAGYGQGSDCRSNVTLGIDNGCSHPGGALVGGQLGYRWQAQSWVFGVEAMGDWADMKGRAPDLANVNNQIDAKTDAFGLFTGQVGYAFNNVLLYAKGGAAVVDQKFDFASVSTGNTIAATGDNDRWGGTVGGGLDVGFAPNWSVGVEYDHIFLNNRNTAFTSVATGAPTASTFNTGGDIDMGTVKLDYRFGGPGLH
jgi:outer membrane immunogenic protein